MKTLALKIALKIKNNPTLNVEEAFKQVLKDNEDFCNKLLKDNEDFCNKFNNDVNFKNFVKNNVINNLG